MMHNLLCAMGIDLRKRRLQLNCLILAHDGSIRWQNDVLGSLLILDRHCRYPVHVRTMGRTLQKHRYWYRTDFGSFPQIRCRGTL